MATIRVILMRRDDLTDEEASSLVSFYPPATEFQIERRDPVDYRQHLGMCEEFKPDVVILPREKPVPVLAMENGYAHISFTPKGFMRLRRVSADFVQFVPGQALSTFYEDEERYGALEEIIEGLVKRQYDVSQESLRILTHMLEELRNRIEPQK